MSKSSEQIEALEAANRRGRRLAVALGAVAAVAVVAAVALGALYLQARVPAGAAARVDDAFVTEDEVARYIGQSRIAASCTEDADFAGYLLSNGYNVATYRNNCVNQLALSMLIDRRAEELGVTVDESQVDEQVAAYKESAAFGDDQIWADTLEQQGTTEEELRGQLATNLRERALYEREVERRDADDGEVLSYARSRMAGQTLKHSYRICFTGDGAWERAQEACKTLKSAGKVDAGAFAALAEECAAKDSTDLRQGSFGWSDDADMPEGYSDVLEGLEAGQFSEPATVDGDDATEIVFCDCSFTFPASSKMGDLELSDLPDDLRSHMADGASDALYDSDCSNYLAWLLARAEITYYPVPKDAAYNVDMGLAGTSGGSGE